MSFTVNPVNIMFIQRRVLKSLNKKGFFDFEEEKMKQRTNWAQYFRVLIPRNLQYTPVDALFSFSLCLPYITVSITLKEFAATRSVKTLKTSSL